MAGPSAAASTSNHVYVRSDDHAWVPARLLESNSDGVATVSIGAYDNEQAIQTDAGAKRTTLQKVKLSDYPNNTLLLQNVDEDGHLKLVEDMVDLSFLHEVSQRGCGCSLILFTILF